MELVIGLAILLFFVSTVDRIADNLGKMADNFGKMAIALAEIRDRLPPPTATNNPNP